jgi:hypothetical protein
VDAYIFKHHCINRKDWTHVAPHVKMDRVTFYKRVAKIQERLGLVWLSRTPYPLSPPDSYFRHHRAEGVRPTIPAPPRTQRGPLVPPLAQAAPAAPRPVLNDAQRQQIAAMAAGAPPEGHVRWTQGLVAKEAVSRGLAHVVGHASVKQILLANGLRIDGRFGKRAA